MGERRARVSLAAVVFAVLLAQVLLYPGIDTLVATLEGGDRIAASMWFLAAEFAAFAAFAGVWGAASDATGRRVPLIAAGAGLGSLGYVALAALPGLGLGFGVALGVRVLQGAATIGAFSLAMTTLMDLGGGHGRNMGAAGIAIGLGTALGAPIGGRLYEVGVLVPVYAAAVLLAVVAVGVLAVDDRAPQTARRKLAAVVVGLRKRPALGLPYAFGFIDRFTAGFFALVGTLYFRRVFELTPGETGLALAAFFAPFALLQYPFGILSDRVGRAVPIVGGSGAYGLAVVGVGLADTAALAQGMMLVVGVLGALMAPATMALVTDLAGPAERGVAMAGFNVAGSLGFLAGVVGGGTVAERAGFFTAFLVAGGVETALALLTIPAFLRVQAERSSSFG